MGVCGLYFIFLKEIEIPYPFRKSRFVYIGMSEHTIRCSSEEEGIAYNEDPSCDIF